MKILVIANEFPTLSETFVAKHVEELVSSGNKVVILAGERAGKDGALKEFNLAWGEDLIDSRYPAVKDGAKSRAAQAIKSCLFNLFKLKELLRMFKLSKNPVLAKNLRLFPVLDRKLDNYLDVDLVHCHFAGSSEIYRYLIDINKLNAPAIVHLHGVDVHGYPLKYGIDCYAELEKYNVRFIGNSRYTANAASKFLHVSADQIDVIKAYVNIRKFDYRDRLLNDDGVVRFITVGRFVEKKGHFYALRACKILIDNGYSLHYTMVGDGPLKAEILDLIEELNISDFVTLTGHLLPEQVALKLDESSIFLAPSVRASCGDMEGQGVVLQEAQAMGLPVVATDHNGFSESLMDGVTGFLVEERNELELSEVMEKLINIPDQWVEFGKKGRAFVEEKFAPSLLTNQWLDVYRKLLDKNAD